MSKNKTILIFSGIGLAVLGGVTALLMLTAPEKEEKQTTADDLLGIPDTTAQTDVTADDPDSSETQAEEAAPLVLSEREENEVKSVEITNELGTYSITNSGKTDSDGCIIWTIADIAAAPLSESSLTSAVTNAAGLEAKEYAEEVSDSSQLTKYGLDAPRATVKTTFEDGSEFTFKLGKDVPNSSTTLYMTADDKKVYTVNKSKTDLYLGGQFSFVELKAFHDYDNSSGEEVKKMSIERIDFDEPLELETVTPANEGDIVVYSYRLTSPYTAYADLTDAPSFMYSIFGLNAAACEWVGLEDRDYELAGLNTPNCVITVETSVKTYTLTIGKALVKTSTDEDGNESQTVTGFYGISSEVPDVLYRFNADDIVAMKIAPEKLISRLFLMPYVFSLDSVSYSDSESRNVDIKIETIKSETDDGEDIHNFYLNGEKAANDQPIKNLYQYFISASGEELYFDEDKGELLAEITYNYIRPTDGVGGKDVVRFYSSNTDRKVIINLNGENIFKTRQMYVTQLFKNIDSFLSGGEIVLTY